MGLLPCKIYRHAKVWMAVMNFGRHQDDITQKGIFLVGVLESAAFTTRLIPKKMYVNNVLLKAVYQKIYGFT
jgi:hypothetical protein